MRWNSHTEFEILCIIHPLLVDADVAKPDVMNTVGVKGGKGLVDVIGDDSIDLADCILKTDIKNLSILPAGKKHSFTTELLASEKMGNLIDELAQRYHDRVIVIDSPPVLASSASSVLAMHVGQILFVVEADRTSEEEVKEALQLIKNCDNINMILIGNIANKCRGTCANLLRNPVCCFAETPLMEIGN